MITVGQPYVGNNIPTSSLTNHVTAVTFMCTVRPFVIFNESQALVACKHPTITLLFPSAIV